MLTGDLGRTESQLVNWVRQHVCLPDKQRGRCIRLKIRHLNVERKPDYDVHSITINDDPSMSGIEMIDRIVLEIANAAQTDANSMKAGVQSYAISAFYDKDKNFSPRKMFHVAAEEEMDGDPGLSEPANEKGLLTQLMRHNEINAKNSLVSMGYIISTMQKEITSQREMNTKFMEQQIDMTMLVQDMLDRSAARRREEKKDELQVAVIEGAFEHLKVAAPILLNRLAGKTMFPPKMDNELYLMTSLLEGLSPEQQAQLQAMLKPEQLALFAELLGGYEQRKAKLLGNGGGDEGNPTPAQGGGGPLLDTLSKMFEKRSTIVARDQANAIEDDRTRRIEAKALAIRQKLASAKRPK